MRGKRNWLWPAVDQHGVVLDILVQSAAINAAERFPLRVLLAWTCAATAAPRAGAATSWREFLDDLDALLPLVAARESGVPLFLLGASAGAPVELLDYARARRRRRTCAGGSCKRPNSVCWAYPRRARLWPRAGPDLADVRGSAGPGP
jgi:hypothetical protein